MAYNVLFFVFLFFNSLERQSILHLHSSCWGGGDGGGDPRTDSSTGVFFIFFLFYVEWSETQT